MERTEGEPRDERRRLTSRARPGAPHRREMEGEGLGRATNGTGPCPVQHRAVLPSAPSRARLGGVQWSLQHRSGSPSRRSRSLRGPSP